MTFLLLFSGTHASSHNIYTTAKSTAWKYKKSDNEKSQHFNERDNKMLERAFMQQTKTIIVLDGEYEVDIPNKKLFNSDGAEAGVVERCLLVEEVRL